MGCGVLYTATGERYVQEAADSARSVRDSNPTLPVGVLTSVSLAEDARRCHQFDDIVELPDSMVFDDIRDKAYNLDETPYERTLYLDTDTTVLGDLAPVFDALDRFDVLAAHAPYRSVELADVPDAFPELNGGVIAYRSCDRVDELFDTWIERYERQIEHGRSGDIPIEGKDDLEDLGGGGRMHDQSSFREAIYETDVQFAALPKNYNFRHSGRVHGEVKILHAGPASRRRLQGVINASPYGRTYVRSIGKLFYEDGSSVALESPLQAAFERVAGSDVVITLLRKTGTADVAERVYSAVTSNRDR
jgi:hypothetical protein